MATATIVTASQSDRTSWTTLALTWGELTSEIEEKGYNLSKYNALWHRPGRGNIAVNDDNLDLTFDGEENIIIMISIKDVSSGMSYISLSMGQLHSLCKKRGIQYELCDSKEVINGRLLSYDEAYQIDSNNPYAALVTASNLDYVKEEEGTPVKETPSLNTDVVGDPLQEAYDAAFTSEATEADNEEYDDADDYEEPEEETDDLQNAFNEANFS